MAKKLSELKAQDRHYFKALMEFTNETAQDDLHQRLKIAQKFGLDLTDEYVIQLLMPTLKASNEKDTEASIIQEQAITAEKPRKPNSIYGGSWMVMQNRLLNAITDLNLNERRLIIFLSPIVRKQVEISPDQRTFEVRVKDFADEYGIKGNYLYKELENVADTILEKVFFFWYDRKGGRTKKGVSWVSECDYMENEGLVRIKLDNTVIEMLTVFDKANPFTKYERKQIVNLGSYGVILFELIASCMHQNHKEKGYTVNYLREKFNCINCYKPIADFKRYVLDKAIKDIENHTPYRIKYTQNKRGRVVYEIVFSFEDVREKVLKGKDSLIANSDKDTKRIPSWNTKGLSDAQIRRLAVHTKDFVDANSNKVSPKERRGYPAVFNDWKPLLQDPKTIGSFKMIQEILDRN